nr:hypothetical protein BaRGS_023134 [Batillaria attramentaria]
MGSNSWHCGACLCVNRTFVDCADRNLTHVPINNIPSRTLSLNLTSNSISDLPDKIFVRFASLKYLYIANNDLEYLREDVFVGLGQLHVLDLSWNNLTLGDEAYPPGVFRPLGDSLVDLQLQGNCPKGEGNCRERVYRANLTYPDAALCDLVNLKSLYMDGLPDAGFGPGFANMMNLTSLQLVGNTSIETISAQFNEIEAFCEGALDNMPDTLRNVDLFANRLRFGGYFKDLVKLVGLHTLKVDGRFWASPPPRSYPPTTNQQCQRSSGDGGEACGDYWGAEAQAFEAWTADTIHAHRTHLYRVSAEDLENADRLDRWAHDVDVLEADFTDLQPTFPSLTFVLPPNLKTLKSRCNQLYYKLFRLDFDPNNSLKTLDLSSNLITTWIGPVTGLNLSTLNLANNFASDVRDTFFQSFTSITTLVASRNSLKNVIASDTNGTLLAPLVKLEVLELAKNYIHFIPRDFFKGLVSLKTLNLMKNRISDFTVNMDHMQHLRLLDLSYNQIHILPQNVRTHLDNIAAHVNATVYVVIIYNPIACTCKHIDFLTWVEHSEVTFNKSKYYYCLTSEGRDTEPMDNFFGMIQELEKSCADFAGILVGAVSCCICLMIALTSALAYRFRWKLRYLYYASRLSYRRQHNEEDSFEFDAFVSYASEDNDFVHGELLERLEERAGLRLNVHNRDWMPGRPIPSNIVAAVQSSRHTLVVLTRHLLESDWCQYEMQMATMEAAHSGRDVLLFLLYEDVPSHELPRQVLYNLQASTYILNLTAVPNESLPLEAETLILRHNRLESLPDGVFARFQSLKYLDLSGNQLQELSTDVFLGLDNLHSLDLAWNNLTLNDEAYPPGVFRPFNASLVRLRLNHNCQAGEDNCRTGETNATLTYPDKALSDLAYLETLYIDGLPESLRQLNMSDCIISSIEPEAFKPLPTLETLDISYNKYLGFDMLADAMNTSISSISAKYNRIEAFCEGALGHMPDTLEFVDLLDNPLGFGRYFKDLGKLKSLKKLTVDGRSLASKPPHEYPPAAAPVCQKTPRVRKETCGEKLTLEADVLEAWKNDFMVDTTTVSSLRPHTTHSLTFVLPPNLQEFISRWTHLYYQLLEVNFDPNNTLHTLDLSKNILTIWIGPITGLNLTTLNLRDNFARKVSYSFFKTLTSLSTLDIGWNRLRHVIANDVNGTLFEPLVNLQVLDLSANYINNIPIKIFRGLFSLKQLVLSRNEIVKFFVDLTHMRHLTLLDLSYNQIHYLPQSTMNHLDNIVALYNASVYVVIIYNPIACVCTHIDFLTWVEQSEVHFNESKNYYCLTADGQDSEPMENFFSMIKELEKSCADFSGILVGAVSCFICLMIALTSALAYRFRWKLRYLYYASRLNYRRQQNEEDSFEFDAFVSYASEDNDFVHGELVERLEERAGLRLNVHNRDWIPGRPIPSNIVAAVQSSRRTLVVLTRHLLESDWCQYEMQMATMEAAYTGRDVLLFLLYEDVPSHELPRQVLYNLQASTYILSPNKFAGLVVRPVKNGLYRRACQTAATRGKLPVKLGLLAQKSSTSEASGIV